MMVRCPLCGAPSTKKELAEARWLEPSMLDAISRARPGWRRRDGACPACVQHALLHTLLEHGEAVLDEGIQTVWPLHAEDAFGAIPTPLRMRADPRFTGKGMTIALIDSGFYPHPDLTLPENRIRAWVDASSDSLEVRRFERDDVPSWPGWDDASEWHGLMTSAVAAGNGHFSHGFYCGLASEAGFGEIRHAGGISPAWPISYRDLAPYYTRAERLYHAHGQRGLDPTEPPTDDPYPYPPLPHEPRVKQLEEDLKRLGYKPFPLPLGVRLGDDKPYPQAPTVLSAFDGYPDPSESKADAHVIAVKPALEHPNVTLLTHRFVERLETSPSGREVTKVIARNDGEGESYSANLVVVSAGAANSAAIMLRSADDRHPNGLANSSGLVGRNYMCHQNSTFVVISKEPNTSIFQKTLVMSDFYGPSEDWEYPMGLIQMLGKVDET